MFMMSIVTVFKLYGNSLLANESEEEAQGQTIFHLFDQYENYYIILLLY